MTLPRLKDIPAWAYALGSLLIVAASAGMWVGVTLQGVKTELAMIRFEICADKRPTYYCSQRKVPVQEESVHEVAQ